MRPPGQPPDAGCSGDLRDPALWACAVGNNGDDNQPRGVIVQGMRSLWLDGRPIDPAHPSRLAHSDVDVAIVGAGLTGLSLAVMLTRAGRSVLVLEDRYIGAGATGNTTGKVSLLQGSVLSDLISHTNPTIATAYVEANLAGQAWLREFCDNANVPYQVQDAYTYATTGAGADRLDKELRACNQVGLDVDHVTHLDLPYSVQGAIVRPDQFQIDPMDVLVAMAAEIRTGGGHIVEGVRVTGAGAISPTHLTTSAGAVRATCVVLATGMPILDRGLYFAKLEAHRSYAMSFRLPTGEQVPDGMYLSLDQPTRSLRGAPDPSGQGSLLLVGGNDHQVGRHPSPKALTEDLTAWTQSYWPDAVLTHSWSAQDYRAAHRVPTFGTMPHTGGAMYVATGYNKWGMANAAAAALALTAQIGGAKLEWAHVMEHRPARPKALLEGAGGNLSVGAHLAKDWIGAVLSSVPQAAPAEGVGVVGRSGRSMVATSTADGTTCSVSAICPHLGGIVAWNDAEKTWDCPLHGSRFAADGTRLEGPATADLASQE